jgi:TonB family protein
MPSQPMLPETAPFPAEQITALNRIMSATNAEQRTWLSGFLAGFQAATAPPPSGSDAAPAVAPAATALPSFDFSDGAHEVQSISDPNGIYKALVEHTLRSRWNRPEDMADDNFVAEVELTIDKNGDVNSSRWVSGSGDARWDKTVKDAVAQLKTISHQPPKGFPDKFLVRFDVESTKTETLEFSSR